MKEFIVFRAHNLANPVGTLQVNDGVARELALHFKDHDSLTLGAGYVKSGDEIEIVEVALMFRDSSKDERLKIARFLRGVFEASTHGASSLMARAIKAVEDGDMFRSDKSSATDDPLIPT